jgi:hypothetical protein
MARGSLAKLPTLVKDGDRRSKKGKKGRRTGASDPERIYKQTLERYITATGQIPVQEEDIEARRQHSWMQIIFLVTRTKAIAVHIFEERTRQIAAAKRIRLLWRTYNLRGVVRIIGFIKVRSNIGWRLTLWMRIVKKRIAVRNIVFLLSEVKRLKTSAGLIPIFHSLRHRMKQAQRMVRDFLLCKQARLLLLSKKWDRIEQEAGKKLFSSRENEFKEKINNASTDLVGVGGALHGVSRLNWQLTKMEQQANKFENPKTEALFNKIQKSSRRDQNYGANEAKFEVLCFVLDQARTEFKSRARNAIGGIEAERDKRRAEALEAKKEGRVAQSEIDEMRDMLKSGDLTCQHRIGLYMLEFKMGIKGQKPPQREFPYFLMLQFIPDERMSDLIAAANRRGKQIQSAKKPAGSYFRRSSLVQYLSASHSGEKKSKKKQSQLASIPRQIFISQSAPGN